MSHFEPFKLGKYLMLQRLGRGGMAEVYLAKTEGAGRFEKKFAVKRLLSPFCDDPQFIAMFEQEANVFCLLDHPNIAQVYDFLRVEDTYLLVMEFIDGPTAGQMVGGLDSVQGVPKAAVAAFVVSKVLAGLDYAHKKTDENTGLSLDIIHRDISPQNIMVKRNGEVKIIDFGIARMALSRALTRPGTIKGKIGYSAPEQLEDLKVDSRTDLYSTAVVLYEFLTGQHLFEAESEGALIRKIIDGVLPDFSSDPRIPAPLVPLLQSALASKAESRMATAEEFRAGLASFLENQYPGFGQAHVADLLAQTQPTTHTDSVSSYSSLARSGSKESTPIDQVKTTLIDMGSDATVADKGESHSDSKSRLASAPASGEVGNGEPIDEYSGMVTLVTSSPISTEDPSPDREATRVLDTPEFKAAAASIQSEPEAPKAEFRFKTSVKPKVEAKFTVSSEPLTEVSTQVKAAAAEAEAANLPSLEIVDQSLPLEGPDLIPPVPNSDDEKEAGAAPGDFWSTRVRERVAGEPVTEGEAVDAAPAIGETTLVTEGLPGVNEVEEKAQQAPEVEKALVPAPSSQFVFAERAVLETEQPFHQPPGSHDSGKSWNFFEKVIGTGAVLGLIFSLYLLVPQFLTATGGKAREAALGNPAALGLKAAPQVCLLNLTSDPAVADVRVNNEIMGQTPMVIRVPCAEDYSVRIEKIGFEPTVRQVKANEVLDKWYVTLHPATVGQVQIWMDFNAKLFVDDAPAGQITPNQTFKVLVTANQVHKLRVQNAVLGINQVWVMQVGPEKVLNTSLLLSDLLPSNRQIKKN